MIICLFFFICCHRRKNGENDCPDEHGNDGNRDGRVHIVDIVAVNTARDTRN